MGELYLSTKKVLLRLEVGSWKLTSGQSQGQHKHEQIKLLIITFELILVKTSDWSGFPRVLEKLENNKFIFLVKEMSWHFTMSENVLEMFWKKYFHS